jgi:hypothetical protein
LNYAISPAIAILAGPEAGLLIQAQSSKNGEKTNITHDVEERSIGLTGGLVVKIYKNIFFSIRYIQGLNHIGIGQRSDIKEFKYEAVNLTTGILF